MKRFFKVLITIGDKLLDVIIWLHDAIMLYISITWLMPLFAAILFSWLIFDLRPLAKGHSTDIFLYSLLGFPLWLRLCLYAEFASTPLADRIKRWLQAAPAFVGFVVLGLGGVFWLFGVF